MQKKIDILNLNFNVLKEMIQDTKIKDFYAKEIFKWLHEKLVTDIFEMTNLSKRDREKIEKKYYLPNIKISSSKTSKTDQTKKYLFELEDNLTIESVLLKHKTKKGNRNTICVSTQVGCPIKCKFCATGQDTFKRDLKLSEILNQVYFIERELNLKDQNVNNIVFMGMGEPLLNFNNLLDAIDILNEGLKISKRKITISTVGIIPKINDIIEQKLSVNLAISLHSTDNKKRDQIIPINKKYPLKDLFNTLDKYEENLNRKLMFEYILIKNFNMDVSDLEGLCSVYKRFHCAINLIPYNKIDGAYFTSPTEKECQNFYYNLKKRGVNVILRNHKGRDLKGSCGQLRSQSKNYEEKKKC